jgi:hypothetical protein
MEPNEVHSDTEPGAGLSQGSVHLVFYEIPQAGIDFEESYSAREMGLRVAVRRARIRLLLLQQQLVSLQIEAIAFRSSSDIFSPVHDCT